MLKLSSIDLFRADKKILSEFSTIIDTQINTALIGPSGCGKSSLLKCLLGIIPASAGEISFNNIVYQNSNICLPIEKRELGIVFQNLILFDHMTVSENIAYGILESDTTKKNKKIQEFLDLFNLSNRGDQISSTLSGGEQQRLALARTMASEPQYLLLDEVFSSIDPLLRDKVRADIRSILKTIGQGSLLVTHDMDDVREFADEVIILDERGYLVQRGLLSEVVECPNCDYVRELFK